MDGERLWRAALTAATFGDLEVSLPSYWTSRCTVLRTDSTRSTMLGCVAPTIDWQDRQEDKSVDSRPRGSERTARLWEDLML